MCIAQRVTPDVFWGDEMQERIIGTIGARLQGIRGNAGWIYQLVFTSDRVIAFVDEEMTAGYAMAAGAFGGGISGGASEGLAGGIFGGLIGSLVARRILSPRKTEADAEVNHGPIEEGISGTMAGGLIAKNMLERLHKPTDLNTKLQERKNKHDFVMPLENIKRVEFHRPGLIYWAPRLGLVMLDKKYSFLLIGNNPSFRITDPGITESYLGIVKETFSGRGIQTRLP